jgi:hypothetical protein
MSRLGEAAIRLENPFAGDRRDQQFGQRPDQRVDPVGRVAGRVAVEIMREAAHLVFEPRQRAEMMDPALLVERGDRLGPRDLAA